MGFRGGFQPTRKQAQFGHHTLADKSNTNAGIPSPAPVFQNNVAYAKVHRGFESVGRRPPSAPPAPVFLYLRNNNHPVKRVRSYAYRQTPPANFQSRQKRYRRWRVQDRQRRHNAAPDQGRWRGG
jgi:hypothetical protein